jgi:hypothetical protein
MNPTTLIISLALLGGDMTREWINIIGLLEIAGGNSGVNLDSSGSLWEKINWVSREIVLPPFREIGQRIMFPAILTEKIALKIYK